MVRVRDLGTLEGDVLLFGGPYSNVQATQALMGWADRAGIPPTRRICTGDIVAYCGDAAATLDLIRNVGCPVVAGNCEVQLAEAAGDCGCGFEDGTTCSILSKGWYAHALGQISKADRAWLGSVPERLVFKHNGRRYAVIHGGVRNISRFLWPVTSDDDFWWEISLLQEEVGAIDAVIAGHSGIEFVRNIDGIRWINAGVIGMPPNDGQQDTSFAVLSDGDVRFESLTYDVAGAVVAMKTAGLTQGYHESLETGYWPSEDVLPKSMRRQSDAKG